MENPGQPSPLADQPVASSPPFLGLDLVTGFGLALDHLLCFRPGCSTFPFRTRHLAPVSHAPARTPWHGLVLAPGMLAMATGYRTDPVHRHPYHRCNRSNPDSPALYPKTPARVDSRFPFLLSSVRQQPVLPVLEKDVVGSRTGRSGVSGNSHRPSF